MRKHRNLLILVLSAIFLVFGTTPAFACTPLPETPWFDEHVVLLTQNLPQGIQVLESDESQIVLINDTANTVYIQGSSESFQRQIENKIIISASRDGLFLNGLFVENIEDRNIIQDNRPQEVTFPAPQDIVIHLAIGKQPLTLQIRVSYVLNEDYRPDSVYQFGSCGRYYFWSNILNPVTLGFATAIVLGFIVLLITLKVKKSRGKQIDPP
jgi:hypothetical protein